MIQEHHLNRLQQVRRQFTAIEDNGPPFTFAQLPPYAGANLNH
jgi:hypothetical protein